jgi:hypothetical protein
VSARVAEGSLLCEDDVLAVPSDVLVRSEADRERRSEEPRSVTDDAMLCLLLLACLRRCGVVGTLGGNWYWSGSRGEVSSSGLVLAATGVRLSVGGDRVDSACLCPLFFPPKNEGRREKMP